jgi:signal transduction histidine kinase
MVNTILYIDDEQDNLLSFSATFRRRYNIITATSAQQATELLKQHQVALIITDQRMPQVSGTEFLKQIAHLYPHTLRIILTGYSNPQDIINAINDGKVYKYITKPWDPAEMGVVIQYALEHYNLKLQNHHLQQQLVTNEANLEKAQVREQFFTQVSHELRSPLNIIAGMADKLLDEYKLPEDAVKYLQHIKNAGSHLNVVINDVLDASKLNAGKMELLYSKVHLYTLINELMESFELKAKQKNLFLKLKVSNVPEYIIIDKVRLNQILFNLMANAVNYTINGGITLSIAVAPHANDISFKVIDTGIGISPDMQAVVFDAFTQVQNTHTQLAHGTGLGLAITKQLVQLLGGNITLNSITGQGSTFTVHLPLSTPQQATVQQPISPQQLADISQQLAGIKILIVDDEPLNIVVVQHMLAGIPQLIIDTAAEGDEAIQKSIAKEYDIILMDLKMPVLDGFKATELIRANNKLVCIIALTANAFEPEVQKCLAVGMNDYITKPTNKATLLTTIYKHYELS